MRTVGIIAEYNPFHRGHEYLIRQARKLCRADYVIIVMSPDFVQRGEPAVFGKSTRAKMALLCGADLVLELPLCYATGSAEYFAEGSVRLLQDLGVTDALCFGTEGPLEDPDPFFSLAGELLEEPEAYKAALRENLKKGLTFPQARAAAVKDPYGLLASPNSSLGVEYCKALLKFDAGIAPVPILRAQSSAAAKTGKNGYCCARAIRKAIRDRENTEKILQSIPRHCASLFSEAEKTPVFSDDFLPFLNQKLLFGEPPDRILDSSKDLSGRILRLKHACIGKSFEEIVSLLQSRQFTKSRIRRVLLHLILAIRGEEVESFRAQGPIFYARILGFRREAAPLLHEIKKKSRIPLLTKAAQAPRLLCDTGKRMWEMDLSASHLYSSVLSTNYGIPFRSEYETGPVIL